MKAGLFINNIKAQDSIYESGLMVYNCLRLSSIFKIDYTEISREHPKVPGGYDFYFINYHPSTMKWVDTSRLKKIVRPIISMVLEVLPDDPFVMCPKGHFDAYCVLDPTINKRKNVYPFPRPLEKIAALPTHTEKEIPVIGSFGFATKGKGFQHVVEAVNKEFDRAVVRINIPFGDFVPESEKYAKFLANICTGKAKPGIEVKVTHDYMSKEQLISWCAENPLNCFLYDSSIPGLAATADQAIVSERPLAVSLNDTFRHILTYLKPYPESTLRESIQNSVWSVKQMKQDWAPKMFTKKFEEMLDELNVKIKNPVKVDGFVIPTLHKNLATIIATRYRKYTRYMTLKKIKRIFTGARKPKHEELI